MLIAVLSLPIVLSAIAPEFCAYASHLIVGPFTVIILPIRPFENTIPMFIPLIVVPLI
jgi:hypothetical protein